MTVGKLDFHDLEAFKQNEMKLEAKPMKEDALRECVENQQKNMKSLQLSIYSGRVLFALC